MAINRIRCVWTGFPGGPGVSTFYSLQPSTDLGLLHGFFDGIKSYLPTDVTVTIEGSGDILDETTGNLTGGWTDNAPAAVAGLNESPVAAPAGFVVIWETGVVMDGTRLRGKTYIVPVGSTTFEANGSIQGDTLTTIRGVASSLAAENQLVVWHRPRAARAADGSRPAVTARAGGYASFSGATVRDFVAVLTSRRD